MFYYIANITADNRRPNMPESGFIVRYGLSDHGWKYQKCFSRIEDAEVFAESLAAIYSQDGDELEPDCIENK